MFDLRKYLGSENNFERIGEESWKLEIQGKSIEAALTGNQDRIYVGSKAEKGKLICLDLSGDIKWKLEIEGGVKEKPVVSDGKVYLGDEKSNFYCIDKEKGEINWKFRPDIKSYRVSGEPEISGNKALTGYSHGTLYCLDEEGSLEWEKSFRQLMSTPRADEDRIYLGISGKKEQNGGKVASLDIDTGDVNWNWDSNKQLDQEKEFPPTNDLMVSKPLIHSRKLFIGSNSGFLYCLDKISGELKWRFSSENSVASDPVMENNRIYFGDNSGIIYCVNLEGELIWKYDTGNKGKIFSPSPAVSSEGIYFSNDDRLYLLDREGSLKWSFELDGSSYSKPLITPDKIALGTLSGHVYGISRDKPP